MKRYLSLIILFSIFLFQIHGINHSESDVNDIEHRCTICEIVSHQPGLRLTPVEIDLNPYLASAELYNLSKNYFIPSSVISKNLIPRAPPVI